MLTMTDAGSGTHDLNVAGYGPNDIAKAIFARDGALADMGNDFHLQVRVTAEARAGLDFVVDGCPFPTGPISQQIVDRSCHLVNATDRPLYGAADDLKAAAAKSITARTLGNMPRRETKTRCRMPSMPLHSGSTRTSAPVAMASRQ